VATQHHEVQRLYRELKQGNPTDNPVVGAIRAGDAPDEFIEDVAGVGVFAHQCGDDVNGFACSRALKARLPPTPLRVTAELARRMRAIDAVDSAATEQH